MNRSDLESSSASVADPILPVAPVKNMTLLLLKAILKPIYTTVRR